MAINPGGEEVSGGEPMEPEPESLPADLEPESQRAGPEPAGQRDSAFWSVYWTSALDKWRETERGLSRVTSFMVLTAVLFELINRNIVSEVDLNFATIKNPRFVLAFVPIVFGYLTLSCASFVADIDWLSRAYWSAFERHYQGNRDHEMWYRVALVPSGGVTNAISRMDYKSRGPWEAIASFGNYFKATIFLLWPVAFELYAATQVLRQLGLGNLLAWTSAVVTIFLMFFAFSTVFSGPETPSGA